MARNHARVLTSIWRDAGFLTLSPEAQRAYMLLLSQPDLSPCGVLAYLPRRWARLAAGTTEADMEKAVLELAESPDRFVVVDQDTDELAIRTYLIHDGGLNNTKMRGAAKSALKAVHSQMLRAVIVDVIPDEYRDEITDGIAYPIADPMGDPVRCSSANPNSGSPMRSNAEVGGRRQETVTSSSPGLTLDGVASDAPNPPREESPPKTKRGTRVPDPFDVTEPMIAWVLDRCPGLDWERETEKFINYWAAAPGQRGVKLDWIATWRKWMLESSDRKAVR